MSSRDADATDAARKRRAMEAIGVARTATPAEIQAGIVRHIRDMDFALASRDRDAIDVLCGRSLAAGDALEEEARRAVLSELRRDVQEFAVAFYDLPTHERRERWEVLRSACASEPVLTERLHAMEPGLSIDRGAISDRSQSVLILAHSLCEMFVRPPRSRILRGHELLENIISGRQKPRDDWVRVAKRVKKRHPEIAALEPQLISRLASISFWQLPAGRRLHRAGTARLKTSSVWLGVLLMVVGIFLGGVLYLSIPQPPAVQNRPPASMNDVPPDSWRSVFWLDVRAKLDTALKSLDRGIDERRLNRVVNLLSYQAMRPRTTAEEPFAEAIENNSKAALDRALKSVGITLDELQLDTVARSSLPCFRTVDSPGAPTKQNR
jgi:hypothetical protein